MPFFAKEADPSGETGPADGAVSVTPCTREWTGWRDLWMKSMSTNGLRFWTISLTMQMEQLMNG